MKKWTVGHDIWIETKRLASSHTLKRCVFCGAVNALSNEECFVCSWHGSFDTSPKEVEQGVHQLFDHCPELAMAMIDKATHKQAKRTWLQKLAAKFATVLRGNVKR